MNNTSKLRTMVTYSILIAIMAVMAFTHLGYIKLGIVEITLMSLPVIIGVGFTGIKGGLILGTVFGITSFLQCFGTSAFGVALLEINPILTFILCMLPRIIMGVISGGVYELSDNHNVRKTITYPLVSVLAPLTNTLIFVPLTFVFFGKSDYIADLMQTVGANSILAAAITIFGLNAICEIAVCAVVGPALLKALEKVKNVKN